MLVPVAGFAPDADATQPGVLTAVVSYVPTYKGMAAAASPVNVNIATLAAACRGSAVVTKLDSTRRLFAGTATKLYESSGATWTDQSRTVGGAYTVGTDLSWRFAEYGDVALAAQKGDKIQFSNSTGAFENITAAPRASVIEVVGDHVFAFDYNDGSNDHPAGWITSKLADYTNWTPSVANNSYAGDLTGTPGPILGARALVDGIVAYKLNAMYLGIFQGPPIGWSWQVASNSAGALCHEVIVPITTMQGGEAHIYMGPDDFYFYDGSRPMRIGSPLKNYVYGRLNRIYSFKSKALHDPVETRIYFFYPSNNSGDGSLDSCVVYNYRVDRWGSDDRSIEAVVQYIGGTKTYADFQTAYATYDAVPDSTYAATFPSTSIPIPAIFSTAHKLQTLNGTAAAASYTSGDIGDDSGFSCLTRVRPRWVTKPTSATLTNYYRNELGEALTQDGSNTMSGSHFDVLREARWHRGMIETVGNAEFTALEAEFEGAGGE